MKRALYHRILPVVLSGVVSISLFLTAGFIGDGGITQVVANAAEVEHGTCGDNLTWTLDNSGTLMIGGNGDMTDYNMEEEPYNPAPWYDYCTDITTVQIEEGVTGIGQDAFCDCRNITDFTMPESITSIRDYAFYDCDGLTEIVIPAAVTYIGDYAFDKCSGIKKITVNSENKTYDSRKNCNAIIKTDSDTLIRGCQNTVIPDGINSLFYAFSGCDQARVLINSGVANVVETNVSKASDGCIMLGLVGDYIADQQAVLDRINEIRKEACNNGYPNPASETLEPLTAKDYVEIKWSEDLEYIARIRAAEASLNINEIRPNNEETFSISGPNNEKSHGEVRLLNYTEEIMSAIDGEDGWYSEKEYWNAAVQDSNKAGSYIQIIDPRNTYIGLGTFLSPHTYYENCTVGEFSYESDLVETKNDMVGKCIQELEVSCENISDPVILGMLEAKCGDTEWLSVAVNADFSNEVFESNFVEQLHVMDDITWTSSDESVATIDENGKVLAKFPGETTITADFGLGTTATANYVVAAKPGWQKIDGDWYYFEQNGTMAVNKWMKDSKGWCWLQADGKMLTNGWAKDSKGYCWIGGSGYMVVKTQWIQDEGIWYHITNGYRDQNKWVQKDGKWCYVGSEGTMVTSTWKKDSKGWCYLDADGFMVTNGWAQDSKGWCWIASNGYMPVATKWIQYDGGWYHITKGYRDENKWMKDSQGWCWLQEGGRMLTNGWAQDSKGWCWIASNGYMPTTTQWVKYDGGWYHITKGYRDQNKWMKDSQGWCWLQEDGRMLTNGWAKDSKGWCWIGPSGYMEVKTKWVQDKAYYIENGYRVVSKTLTIDGKTYEFDADGHWTEK